jgi:hypothetical protein
MMTEMQTQTQALVVHAVTEGRRHADQMHGYEVRSVGLLSAGFKLGTSFGDFDCVRLANARADLRSCPVCRPPAPTS